MCNNIYVGLWGFIRFIDICIKYEFCEVVCNKHAVSLFELTIVPIKYNKAMII